MQTLYTCTTVLNDKVCKLATPPLCKHLYTNIVSLVLVYTTSEPCNATIKLLMQIQILLGEWHLTCISGYTKCSIVKIVFYHTFPSIFLLSHNPHSHHTSVTEVCLSLSPCPHITDIHPEWGTTDCYLRYCLMTYHNISVRPWPINSRREQLREYLTQQSSRSHVHASSTWHTTINTMLVLCYIHNYIFEWL